MKNKVNVNLKICTKNKKLHTQENSVFQNKLVIRASEQSLSAASARGVVTRRMETRPAFPREKHFLPASNTAIYSGQVQGVT